MNSKNKAINRLDLSFLTHIELQEFKQSHLLAYWINDFAIYHYNEKTFNLSKSGRYVRGSIIKVNFGYNIGNELKKIKNILIVVLIWVWIYITN